MKRIFLIMLVAGFFAASVNSAYADVIPSDNVIAEQQRLYNKQQILDMVDSQQVQDQLVALGVNPADAKKRIANMTDAELAEFQRQMDELPAGQGVVSAIVTVLVVIALLDVLGVTDVYPFIRPIS